MEKISIIFFCVIALIGCGGGESLEGKKIVQTDESKLIQIPAAEMAFSSSKEEGDLLALKSSEFELSSVSLFSSILEGAGNNLSDYNMIIIHGQSNAAGIDALRQTHEEYLPNRAYRFKRGIHTWIYNDNAVTPHLRPSSDFVLEPLSASYTGLFSSYETMAHGMAAYLSSNTSENHKFIFSYPGEGGRFLRELNKRHDLSTNPANGTRTSPGGYYATLIDDVSRAKQIADAEGKSFRVLALVWAQGEAEGQYKHIRYEDAVSRDAFLPVNKSDLIDLKNDLRADILDITQQVNPPYFLSYQTIGTISGQAQLNAHYSSPDIAVISSSYMFETANSTFSINSGTGQRKYGDTIHWAADGQRWMGAQMAKGLLDQLQEGKSISVHPLYLEKIKDGARTIFRIKFNVPKPPLVLDYNSLPKNIGSYGSLRSHSGFKISNGTTHLVINSVSVISDDTVEIVTNEPIPAGGGYFLSYVDSTNYPYFETPIFNASIIGYDEFMLDGDIWFNIKIQGNLNPLPDGSFVRSFFCQTPEARFYIEDYGYNSMDDSTYLTGNFRVDNSSLPAIRNYVGSKFSVGCARSTHTGNLRDSDQREPIYSLISDPTLGRKQPLHNWALAFRWPLDSSIGSKLRSRVDSARSN